MSTENITNKLPSASKVWSSQLWTQFKQLRIEAWKSEDFYGVWIRDLARPVRRSNQLSYEVTDTGGWSFVGSNEPVKNECEVIYEIFLASHRCREITRTGSTPVEILTFSGFYTQLLKFAFITAMIIVYLISNPQLNIWNISYITSQVTKPLYLMRRMKVNIIHAFWCGLAIGLPLPSSKYPSEAMFKDLFQAAKRNGSKYIIIYLNAVSCDLSLHYFLRCHALQYARFVYRNQISIYHCY